MPTWPATLPQNPLRQGYSRGGRAVLIRSQMEVGTAKVRKRTTAGPEPLAVSFRMTTAQKVTFEAFFANDIGFGSERFELPDPEGGAVLTVRFSGGAGQAPYTFTYAAPERWVMTAALEIMP